MKGIYLAAFKALHNVHNVIERFIQTLEKERNNE